MAQQTEQKDWIPPVAIGLGAVGLIGGYILYTRRPRGVDPGDTVIARFRFDYLGAGGAYVLQASFGRLYFGKIFDHVEGLTWETTVALPEPGSYQFDLECPLPQGIETRKYDAEALIRTPDMGQFDSLLKLYSAGAIIVRKG